MTYHRLDVPAAKKDWPVGQITKDVIEALHKFAGHALTKRLDDKTRAALRGLGIHSGSVFIASGSTATQFGYCGGTIPHPGLTDN